MSDSDRLRLAAAQLALRCATGADLKAAASGAADDGPVTPNLAALLTLRDDTLTEAEPLFRMALQDLHLAMPSADEALWLVLRTNIHAIAAGSTDPEKGLERIVAISNAVDLHGRSAKTVGDSHGIQYLLGTYWELHDVRAHTTEVGFQQNYGSVLETLRSKAVEHAKTWLADHAA